MPKTSARTAAVFVARGEVPTEVEGVVAETHEDDPVREQCGLLALLVVNERDGLVGAAIELQRYEHAVVEANPNAPLGRSPVR